MWDVQVSVSDRAFERQLQAEAFAVVDRFDAAGRMGLIPRGITEVMFSYDFDVPAGMFRIFTGDQLIVAIETPHEQLAQAPVSFKAQWLTNNSRDYDPIKPDWGGWYVTTPDELGS